MGVKFAQDETFIVDLLTYCVALLGLLVWVPDLFFRYYFRNEFLRGPRFRPRAVVACKSGKVWNVLGVLLVYKWRSFDRSLSFRCDSTIER